MKNYKNSKLFLLVVFIFLPVALLFSFKFLQKVLYTRESHQFLLQLFDYVKKEDTESSYNLTSKKFKENINKEKFEELNNNGLFGEYWDKEIEQISIEKVLKSTNAKEEVSYYIDGVVHYASDNPNMYTYRQALHVLLIEENGQLLLESIRMGGILEPQESPY